jgi:hypothetical protein
MGFEQVPTGSCWNNSVNITQLMGFTKEKLTPALFKGFMVAPWMSTRKSNFHALLNDAERMYYARKRWYPETL